MVMFSVFTSLGVIVGLSMYMLPLVAVLLRGGPMKMVQLVERKELNYLDFVDLTTCKAMLLLYAAFVWVYHEVHRDISQNKQQALDSWRYRRHRSWGMECKVHMQQKQSMEHLLEVELELSVAGLNSITPGSCLTDSQMPENNVYIEQIVAILEQVPGWASCLEEAGKDFYHHEDGAESMFEMLSKDLYEFHDQGVWPLDMFLVKSQYETNVDLLTGLRVLLAQSLDMLRYIKTSFYQHPMAGCVCVTVALVRSLIARFWLWLMLNGNFWPKDVAGSLIVLFSTSTAFLVGLLWLSLVVVLVLEYRRTLIQVTILTAMADPQARVQYIDYFLNREFDLDQEQITRVLSFLPILSLKFPSNVAAFWRLREYTTFDRSNERIAIEFILEAIIIWLILKFVATFACLYMVDELPAVVAVTLFDLIVFGCLLLYSLQLALQINYGMDKHKQIFAEAKYQVTLAEQNMMNATGVDKSKQLEMIHDMKVARQMLVEYLNMVLEYDRRDKILLGLIVTPGKILSVIASVGGAIGSLLLNMEKKGHIKMPDPILDNGSKFVQLMTNTTMALWPHHFHL